MYYIYLDTKIIGAIQQLIVYFSNQIFPYENTVVIYKKYKKHWQIFNKLFKRKPLKRIYAGWNWFSWSKKVVEYVLLQKKENKSYEDAIEDGRKELLTYLKR